MKAHTCIKCDLLLPCQPSHTPLGMKTSPSVFWSCRGHLSLAELLQWRGRKTGERETAISSLIKTP